MESQTVGADDAGSTSLTPWKESFLQNAGKDRISTWGNMLNTDARAGGGRARKSERSFSNTWEHPRLHRQSWKGIRWRTVHQMTNIQLSNAPH